MVTSVTTWYVFRRCLLTIHVEFNWICSKTGQYHQGQCALVRTMIYPKKAMTFPKIYIPGNCPVSRAKAEDGQWPSFLDSLAVNPH